MFHDKDAPHGAKINGEAATPNKRRKLRIDVARRLIKAAGLVQSGCRYANSHGYKEWIATGGLGLGSIAIILDAPSLITYGLLGGTILVGKAVSTIGGPDPVDEIRNRKPPTAIIPMPVSERENATTYINKKFNSGLLARVCRDERNPFRTPVLKDEVFNDIFEHQNANAGFTIRDETSAMIGVAMLLPMRRERIQALMGGKLAFGEVAASDILAELDRDRCMYADFHLPRTTPNWVSGTSDRDVRNLAAILQGICYLLDEFYFDGKDRNREITLYSLAKHRRGCKLLKQLGFVYDEALSNARKDNRKVFRKALTRGALYQLRGDLNISEADLNILRPKRYTRKH